MTSRHRELSDSGVAVSGKCPDFFHQGADALRWGKDVGVFMGVEWKWVRSKS